jgi:hypothetical protein
MTKTTQILAAALLSTSLFVTSVPVEAEVSKQVEMAQVTSNVIVYAKSLKGIPYKANGTTKQGFDASGFVQHVYHQYGVKLPRTSKEMFKTGLNTSSLQPGDLVFYDTKNKKKKEVSYVGIYIGNSQFISVSVKKGVSIQNMKDSYWKSKYMGAKRVMKNSGAFNVKTVKAGDKINGYTVASVKKGESDDGQLYFITFKEPVSVTGHYKIIKTNYDVLHFFVNQKDVPKLPLYNVGNLKKGIINFQDQEKVHAAFQKIKPGAQVTITVKNYTVAIWGNNAYVENAEFAKINN